MIALQRNIINPIILCGGLGTRLWPASRERHPQELIPFTEAGRPSLQAIATRAESELSARCTNSQSIRALGAIQGRSISHVGRCGEKPPATRSTLSPY